MDPGKVTKCIEEVDEEGWKQLNFKDKKSWKKDPLALSLIAYYIGDNCSFKTFVLAKTMKISLIFYIAVALQKHVWMKIMKIFKCLPHCFSDKDLKLIFVNVSCYFIIRVTLNYV